MPESYNKVCYVLTSNAKDIYAEMNLLSAWSLQQSNPNIHIILLCDSDTMKALKKDNHEILKHVNEIISVDTPAGSASFRNRYIKTSMHRYIRGPFLYLDADTLIRGDLSPIFSTSASFSAAPNHSGTGNPSEIPGEELNIINRMNWPLPHRYVNGGVLYFSDQPQITRFAEMWHKKWLASNASFNLHYDQPSLNCALDASGIDFSWMHHLYNAQLLVRPDIAYNAVIWHFYFSDNYSTPKTIFDHLIRMDSFKRNKTITMIIERKHPFIIDNLFDKLAVHRLLKSKKKLNRHSWENQWLSDNYIGALKSILFSIIKSAIKNKKYHKQSA